MCSVVGRLLGGQYVCYAPFVKLLRLCTVE